MATTSSRTVSNASGGVDLSQVASDIVPTTSDSFNLGSVAREFNNVYCKQIVAATGNIGELITELKTTDAMIQVADGNSTTDTITTGLATEYGSSGAKPEWAGLLRDSASSGTWTFVQGAAAPITSATNVGSLSTAPVKCSVLSQSSLAGSGSQPAYINNSGQLVALGNMTNGQLLIGNSGSPPAVGQINQDRKSVV